MDAYKDVLRRLLSVLITLFLSSMLIFAVLRLSPGDPVKLFLGEPGLADAETYNAHVNELRTKLGLDNSIPVQYCNWLRRLAHVDFGTSIYTKRPVGVEIASRLPATLVLSALALAIQLALSLPLGIVSAVRAGGAADGIIRVVCVFFASLPGFVLGFFLLSIFAVRTHIYEISNSAAMTRLWLPAITLGVVGAPQLIRMVRTCMLSEFGRIYVISALARGLPRRKIVLGALRNAMVPIMTMISQTFATLMGGSVIIESIFSWPGIGEYAISSVLRHDYPVIQAYAVVTVAIVSAINLLADLAYTLLNPQMRAKRGGVN
jgi:peptide/nickel transport system permease protein